MRRRLNESNNTWTGVILIIIGSIFLLRKLHIAPHWFFGWETVFILVGLAIGVRRRFQGVLWLVFILIGTISMADEIIPNLSIRNYAWPLIFIIIGLYFIGRPRRLWKINDEEDGLPLSDESISSTAAPNEYTTHAEVLDATAIFGSVKKTVVSKNFKGGDIISIMGGTEINFSQADIQGKVRLDAVNFMGGTKLIVPPTWEVQSEMLAIFGGVEDKRDPHSLNIDKSKILVIEGTCIFGGLEIKSF